MSTTTGAAVRRPAATSAVPISHADAEPPRRRIPRHPSFDRPDHPDAKISGKVLSHARWPPSPACSLDHDKRFLGIPARFDGTAEMLLDLAAPACRARGWTPPITADCSGVGGLAGIDGASVSWGCRLWTPGRGGSTARPGFPASCGQTPPVEPAPSLHVVGHVGERDGRRWRARCRWCGSPGPSAPSGGRRDARRGRAPLTSSRWRGRCASGIGLPFGFLRWMRLILPILSRNRSFSAER